MVLNRAIYKSSKCGGEKKNPPKTYENESDLSWKPQIKFPKGIDRNPLVLLSARKCRVSDISKQTLPPFLSSWLRIADVWVATTLQTYSREEVFCSSDSCPPKVWIAWTQHHETPATSPPYFFGFSPEWHSSVWSLKQFDWKKFSTTTEVQDTMPCWLRSHISWFFSCQYPMNFLSWSTACRIGILDAWLQKPS